MVRARAKTDGPGGLGLQHRGLDPSSVRRRRQTVHAGRTRSDRRRTIRSRSRSPTTRSSEQPRAGGLRDQGERPDPSDFVKGSIMRDAAGKPTGMIRGDIAATRPVAARLPKVAPDQLEASSLALVKDMNRAGLTTFGVAGCNADVLEIFQKWKAQGHLNVRVFCIGGASAGSPEQVDRSHPQIAQMKLYQGDEFIDNVVFGEASTRRCTIRCSRSSPIPNRTARAVAPHGDGDCEGRPADPRARGAARTRSTGSSIRSRRSTRNIRSRTCAGRSPTSTRSTRRSSSA